MPTQNVIQDHFTVADTNQIGDLLNQLEVVLQPRLRNLDDEENNRYGTINEANKLLVNKVNDYQRNQPALRSNDIDWAEFEADFFDRQFLEATALRLESLATIMRETKRMHDYDNYQSSLLDYKYAQYKMETAPGMGYDAKVKELKQFFPNTGGNNTPATPEA
jgi:hypothetical protein